MNLKRTSDSRKILDMAFEFLHEFATQLILLPEELIAPPPPVQHDGQFAIVDITPENSPFRGHHGSFGVILEGKQNVGLRSHRGNLERKDGNTERYGVSSLRGGE